MKKGKIYCIVLACAYFLGVGLTILADGSSYGINWLTLGDIILIALSTWGAASLTKEIKKRIPY